MLKALKKTIIILLFLLLFPNVCIAQQYEGINSIIQENLRESTDLFIKNTGEDIQEHVKDEVNTASSEIASKFDITSLFYYLKDSAVYWFNHLWNTFVTSLERFGVYN